MSNETNDGSPLTDGTEQTLATISAPGSYVFRINLTPLALGDRIVLRQYGESRTSESALLLVYETAFSDAQVEVLKVGPPIDVATNGQCRFTMELTNGTNRTLVWSARDLAS